MWHEGGQLLIRAQMWLSGLPTTNQSSLGEHGKQFYYFRMFTDWRTLRKVDTRASPLFKNLLSKHRHRQSHKAMTGFIHLKQIPWVARTQVDRCSGSLRPIPDTEIQRGREANSTLKGLSAWWGRRALKTESNGWLKAGLGWGGCCSRLI